jgi:HrpA-like RNA helicase
MLRYPLEPEHARILLASFALGCPSEIIDILSLTVSGPLWVDRADARESATAARTKFVHRDGDHLTAMNVLRAYLALREQGSGSGGKTGIGAWCRDNCVNGKTLLQASKIRGQLRELVVREGRDPDVSCGSEVEPVLKSLLQGLFMNTAVIQADATYQQSSGKLVGRLDGFPYWCTHRTRLMMGSKSRSTRRRR